MTILIIDIINSTAEYCVLVWLKHVDVQFNGATIMLSGTDSFALGAVL